MATLNQSSVSSKAFQIQPSDAGIGLSSSRRQATTWPRTVVRLAAWLEILVGASFLLVPETQSRFLYGVTPEGIGVTFAQFVGIALMGLGIACLPSNVAGSSQRAARALLVYNIAVAIFFVWGAVATPFRGVLLWPIVIMHTIVAIALTLSLRPESS